jgi:Rieske Fe-S protein
MSDERVVTERGPGTRRAMLAGAGAIGASVVLAGCGTDTTDDPGVGAPPAASDTPGTSASGGAQNSGTDALAKVADVPVGGGVIVAKTVVTQPTEGQFKAFSAVCTHQGCTVANVKDGTINCGCHGSKFSIEDGSVKNGPANKPLEEKSVKQDGGNIVLA